MNEQTGAPAAGREIVTSRLINAPRELVWQAWTDPEMVVQWWGPNGFTNTIETMDLREGGEWKFVMHGPDGTNYKNYSVFVELVKPERIVYDHRSVPHFTATATFEDRDGKTFVTLRSVFPSAADRALVAEKFGAVEGAKQTIARLAAFVEAMQS